MVILLLFTYLIVYIIIVMTITIFSTPLNALLFMNERMLATGDDLGVIKVF